jgi:hypothetical protein
VNNPTKWLWRVTTLSVICLALVVLFMYSRLTYAPESRCRVFPPEEGAILGPDDQLISSQPTTVILDSLGEVQLSGRATFYGQMARSVYISRTGKFLVWTDAIWPSSLTSAGDQGPGFSVLDVDTGVRTNCGIPQRRNAAVLDPFPIEIDENYGLLYTNYGYGWGTLWDIKTGQMVTEYSKYAPGGPQSPFSQCGARIEPPTVDENARVISLIETIFSSIDEADKVGRSGTPEEVLVIMLNCNESRLAIMTNRATYISEVTSIRR